MHTHGHPSVCALVLNYNGGHFLPECLSSLLASDYANLRVYLIDNGSTDHSVELVRSRFPRVRVVALERNVGFSSGYNRVVAGLDADFFFFLNNDISLEPTVVGALIARAEANGDVAALTPKMRFADDRQTLNGCGGTMDKFGFCLNIAIGEMDLGQHDRPAEIFYAIGAAMMVRGSVWREIGGFDERFFAYFEDADWCWRARLLGYRVLYVPSAVVYHKWRGTWTDVTKRMYLQERNRLAMVLKNYSLSTLAYVLPSYLGLALLRIAWVCLHWGLPVGVSMAAGYLWNLSQVGSTIAARGRVQRMRAVNDRQVMGLMARGSLELAHRRNKFLTTKR